MAINNMSLATNALKHWYLAGLRNQINDSSVLLAEMERNTESVFGADIVMALKYGRSGGVGNRADDGTMPTSNPRKKKQATWVTKNIFAHIQITDKTIKASRSKEGAFADLLESDLDDAQTDAKDSMSRQVFGDGTGVVATITTGVTAASFTCSAGVDNISVGQFVDIYAIDLTTVKVAGREVTVVDYDNNTFTIAGANVTVVNTDYVVASGSVNQELTGFGAVFTKDNTLYGINRATDKWFNPHTFALAGEISEVGIQGRIDEVERRAGGKTNLLSGSYGVRRAYQNLLTATKQIVEVTNLKGGYKALTYTSGNMSMPFTVDKYNPKQTMYGLDMETWQNYMMGDWDWLEDGDGAILHLMSGTAIFEATLAKYEDLGCSKPAGNWVMTGIVEH
jgi:hypothetical protein